MPRSNIEDPHREYLENLLLKQNHNRGRCSISKFSFPIGMIESHVNENEKSR